MNNNELVEKQNLITYLENVFEAEKNIISLEDILEQLESDIEDAKGKIFQWKLQQMKPELKSATLKVAEKKTIEKKQLPEDTSIPIPALIGTLVGAISTPTLLWFMNYRLDNTTPIEFWNLVWEDSPMLFLVFIFIGAIIGSLIISIIYHIMTIPIRYKQEKLLKKEQKMYDEEYKKEQEIYDEEHKKEVLKYNQKHDEAKLKFNTRKKIAIEQLNTIKKNNSKILEESKKLLSYLYSQNIIFPKYRDIVPISSFYEYVLSGRCDKLEGADGAYNIYENELRQNLIITNLGEINSNLNGIRNNQYTLYEAISSSKELLNDIKYEISKVGRETMHMSGSIEDLNNSLDNIRSQNRAQIEATKLNNYYSQITSKNTQIMKENQEREIERQRMLQVRDRHSR